MDPTRHAPALASPRVKDGAAIWRIARDSVSLDLNSSYSCLLWCRDAAATSLVARGECGEPVGFVAGHRRPDQPDTLVMWQIAVDHGYRGRGLATRLRDGVRAKVCAAGVVRSLETTITPDNAASDALFRSFACRNGATIAREALFARGPLPDHQAELLYRIGPLTV